MYISSYRSRTPAFGLWIYTKKVDKYDKIEDKQRRNKNDRKEKQ